MVLPDRKSPRSLSVNDFQHLIVDSSAQPQHDGTRLWLKRCASDNRIDVKRPVFQFLGLNPAFINRIDVPFSIYEHGAPACDADTPPSRAHSKLSVSVSPADLSAVPTPKMLRPVDVRALPAITPLPCPDMNQCPLDSPSVHLDMDVFHSNPSPTHRSSATSHRRDGSGLRPASLDIYPSGPHTCAILPHGSSIICSQQGSDTLRKSLASSLSIDALANANTSGASTSSSYVGDSIGLVRKPVAPSIAGRSTSSNSGTAHRSVLGRMTSGIEKKVEFTGVDKKVELAQYQAPGTSSSDECEETTRRIMSSVLPTSAPSLYSNHERKSSWGVGGQQSSLLSNRVDSSSKLNGRDSAESSTSLTAEETLQMEHRRQSRSNYHLTSGQAAVELFLRLNHARQTLDFVKRQASLFAPLTHARMDMWEALDVLNELREYEAALLAGQMKLDPEMPLREHAIQTAELCRLAYPDKDWLHLVGLIHGLGKLLAHKRLGCQPQWATCGESYPLGCRFDNHLQGYQFFSANPDRRRRQYHSQLGIYQSACGLHNVYMSWSAAEYLYLMLLLNGASLPPEALFIIRHQKFYALTEPGSAAYRYLLSPEDEAMLPLLTSFQKLSLYQRVHIPQVSTLSPESQRSYYSALMEKYLGLSADKKLAW
ncbi:hypothetical protein CEUSTIGMA_g9574.t1 [Chlamydomonas eustigma]|uniref:Inositol oxygenase n=1 Tax=Chlamydomonas eustigma TaxID=1157962 RepID=A0A250XGI9_9CHLO|nr:hypothetical protein CEUSTIGMA_g9574.t1 [Chlamydomonas eustigma]|eukprot:GAX82146.1 hypothetical protein CEUSTIGMA_g9574.t1 [Chlamydomonas eustigma]